MEQGTGCSLTAIQYPDLEYAALPVIFVASLIYRVATLIIFSPLIGGETNIFKKEYHLFGQCNRNLQTLEHC
jgi:hypothetical protein